MALCNTQRDKAEVAHFILCAPARRRPGEGGAAENWKQSFAARMESKGAVPVLPPRDRKEQMRARTSVGRNDKRRGGIKKNQKTINGIETQNDEGLEETGETEVRK